MSVEVSVKDPSRVSAWKMIMTTNANVRANAVKTLQHVSSHSRQEVHNAVIDLRRNPQQSDKHLLVPLLDYDDDVVVAATLYALTRVYEDVETYRDVIIAFASGDQRDTGEMPIQTEAIEGLAVLAEKEGKSLEHLWWIAEDPAVPECPRARAWHCLSRIVGVEWKREYYDFMIEDPGSFRSEEIRKAIRTARPA